MGCRRVASSCVIPGFVDDTLVSLDPLTDQREHEYAFLAGEHFPPLLAANKVTLG